ncbi:hypothetical protein AC792_09785 [Arthrobacter sp. RIT-PI-e]|uniref:3-oxo-tetronate kinase n=1 Tax=Arthrobacter sp. RIT-PI-e TaxID=1681197 RepID=UPI0006769225|nr:3-oxo-tetronate kinase [Arthrobacter sp. RIT-PI-e]KNC18867.1 hypothetical protein AC792_09785 [Arthrobacter sp. RIT-PI-e]
MIGVIADDFTGGTDVAVAFRRAGLRVLIQFGPATEPPVDPDVDVIVIALKSRTIPVAEAVKASLEAADTLLDAGSRQLFFKFCSTFDSTREGNIGPVLDALAQRVGSTIAVVVPSSPEHGRTQYQGHLFVNGTLLSDSPMRHHPLTPMTDSRITRLLHPQTKRTVVLVDLTTVDQGTTAIAATLESLETRGVAYAVVDAVDETDLLKIGSAVIDAPLVSGAAGLAGGLAKAVVRRDAIPHHVTDISEPWNMNPAVALAGSCSARTLEQIAALQEKNHPSFWLDAVSVPDPQNLAAAALQWYDAQNSSLPPLIYSSLPPEMLQRSQEALGIERSAEILETAMGLIAQGLVQRGIQRLVVAGGETSGAVVTALQVNGGLIGDEAAPGVPWIITQGTAAPLALLLKSGNFGTPSFLLDTTASLHGTAAQA